MKRLLTLVLFALVTMLALRAYSARSGGTHVAEDARHEVASRVAQGHALVQQGQYDRAIDTFVEVAGDAAAGSDAVRSAGDAVYRKVSADRLPQRLDAVTELGKRLPPGSGRAELRSTVTSVLVDPVVVQAEQARLLLENRRAFVQQMRDTNEGDVLPAAQDRRVLTEAEVADAQRRLADLGASVDMVKLYRYERPLAAAMDRFVADDQRYLAQETVTDADLDEIGNSCDALGDALWPVQRQLDRVRPGWRERP